MAAMLWSMASQGRRARLRQLGVGDGSGGELFERGGFGTQHPVFFQSGATHLGDGGRESVPGSGAGGCPLRQFQATRPTRGS